MKSMITSGTAQPTSISRASVNLEQIMSLQYIVQVIYVQYFHFFKDDSIHISPTVNDKIKGTCFKTHAVPQQLYLLLSYATA